METPITPARPGDRLQTQSEHGGGRNGDTVPEPGRHFLEPVNARPRGNLGLDYPGGIGKFSLQDQASDFETDEKRKKTIVDLPLIHTNRGV